MHPTPLPGGGRPVDEIRCDEQFSFAVDAEENLQVFSREVLSYVFAWTKDKESTRIFLFGPDSTERYEVKLTGQISSKHNIIASYLDNATDETVYPLSCAASSMARSVLAGPNSMTLSTTTPMRLDFRLASARAALLGR